MKIISWNVNGIRSLYRQGFLPWLKQTSPDILCLQEIKAHPNQLNEELLTPLPYHTYWHPSLKAGHSGVALMSKIPPKKVTQGIGIEEIDREGRVLVAEYPQFTLINAYFPNSQREHTRLPFKLFFCEKILQFCQDLRQQGKGIILCGDLNISHKEIDLKNPKSNAHNAGFLPEERAWLDQFAAAGHSDAFRCFESGGGHYTWWSYRPGVRAKNIGWRLDYFWVNEKIRPHLLQMKHLSQVMGSDHCPILLELQFPGE